jgi:hypothetical protein
MTGQLRRAQYDAIAIFVGALVIVFARRRPPAFQGLAAYAERRHHFIFWRQRMLGAPQSGLFAFVLS